MNNNLIITIGRQFGSGGREIGKLLSELFGISYYDKELINEASKSSGLSTEYFEKADERAPSALLNSFSINWLTGAGGIWGDGGLSNEYIFKFQSDVIRHLAETQSCVIVGRCADYILRHYPRCYNIFIHAPLEDRVTRILNRSQARTRPCLSGILSAEKTRCPNGIKKKCTNSGYCPAVFKYSEQRVYMIPSTIPMVGTHISCAPMREAICK